MKPKFTLIALAALIICSSCKKDKPQDQGKDLILTEKEKQQVNADNTFSLKLFKETSVKSTPDENLMLSGLSASMALSMVANGGNGETLQGIRATLNQTGFTEQEINAYYLKLITDLPELDPKAKLKIANSIWFRNTFAILPTFMQTSSESYKVKGGPLDFADPTAKDKINNWVSQETNQKIPTIIDAISSNMMMYLINAVYFKSNWKYKFNKSKTAKADFKLDATRKVNIDMMVADLATINSFRSVDGEVHELPYGNEKYSMVIVLPKVGTQLKDLISSLDPVKWKYWMTGLESHSTVLMLPKFKFSYSDKLNTTLSNMGMGLAFSDAADFSRINAAKSLAISEVKQKTFIEVDEEGTTAAAVTSVGMQLTTSLPSVVSIDRPFMFAIREMKTGLILFTGVVNNPAVN